MARLQIGSVHGVTSNHLTNKNGGDDDDAGFIDADAMTIQAARARLQAIDASAYSDDNLNAMTWNDMVYALRVHDNNALIN